MATINFLIRCFKLILSGSRRRLASNVAVVLGDVKRAAVAAMDSSENADDSGSSSGHSIFVVVGI